MYINRQVYIELLIICVLLLLLIVPSTKSSLRSRNDCAAFQSIKNYTRDWYTLIKWMKTNVLESRLLRNQVLIIIIYINFSEEKGE